MLRRRLAILSHACSAPARAQAAVLMHAAAATPPQRARPSVMPSRILPMLRRQAPLPRGGGPTWPWCPMPCMLLHVRHARGAIAAVMLVVVHASTRKALHAGALRHAVVVPHDTVVVRHVHATDAVLGHAPRDVTADCSVGSCCSGSSEWGQMATWSAQ